MRKNDREIRSRTPSYRHREERCASRIVKLRDQQRPRQIEAELVPAQQRFVRPALPDLVRCRVQDVVSEVFKKPAVKSGSIRGLPSSRSWTVRSKTEIASLSPEFLQRLLKISRFGGSAALTVITTPRAASGNSRMNIS